MCVCVCVCVCVCDLGGQLTYWRQGGYYLRLLPIGNTLATH